MPNPPQQTAHLPRGYQFRFTSSDISGHPGEAAQELGPQLGYNPGMGPEIRGQPHVVLKPQFLGHLEGAHVIDDAEDDALGSPIFLGTLDYVAIPQPFCYGPIAVAMNEQVQQIGVTGYISEQHDLKSLIVVVAD